MIHSKGTPRVKEGPVCVTGASGFIASHLVKQLLERGYTVHGTVRTLANKKKVDHLMALDGAKDRLKLFEADLLKKGSFEAAIADCVCVMHTASPFFIKGASEEKLVKPALQGTENVLNSVTKSETVETVVLTSSTAAIYAHYSETKDIKYVYSEKDWSDKKAMRAKKAWYALSKTLAEEKAWEMQNEAGNKWKLVVMNPTLVWGPMLQPSMNTSSEYILKYLDGSMQEIGNASKTVVDVRDTAMAHILGYEVKEASGRYMLIAGNLTWKEVCSILRKQEPENDRIPSKVSEKFDAPAYGARPPNPTLFDNSKATKELGISFVSPTQQVVSTYESLKKQGFR